MKNYLVFVFLILVTVGVNTICHKFLKQRWNLWLGYGFPALFMMLFMVTVSEPRMLFSDFTKAYYPVGRLILHNPFELYNQQPPEFVNIPIIAFLFTPFSLLQCHHAKILFTIIGGLAVLTTCYLLLKLTKVSGWKRIALIGVFVINGPLYNSLREGNITHFVLLLLLAAFFCLEKKHDLWLGILLGIAALLKIPLFLLGVYFFLRGRWRVIVGFSASLLTIVGASLLLFGIELHLLWLHQCIEPFAGKPLAAFNVQSVSAFLARLLTNNSLIYWLPTEVGWRFKMMQYVLLSVLAGGTLWVCWRSKASTTLEVEKLEFSIFLCLALVTSPISWTHYYLLLLLPVSLYLGNRLAVPQGRRWVSLVVLSILLISPPVTLIESQNLLVRLLISHYFFGGILLLGVLLAARWCNTAQLSENKKPGFLDNTFAKIPSL